MCDIGCHDNSVKVQKLDFIYSSCSDAFNGNNTVYTVQAKFSQIC